MTEAMLNGRPAAPSSEELIGRAAALIPLLRANASLTERLGRLPDENVQAVEEAGLLRMLRPANRGGYGTDAATAAAAMTHVASGCPSTAWVMQIYSGIGRMAESLPAETLAEIYAQTPDAKFAGTFAAAGAVCAAVDGGIRIRGRGRWPFNSGCHHADWDLLRVSIEERDGTTSDAFCLIPLSELTIADDWRVMGAAGTGSNSVECGELFIPERRVSRRIADAFTALQVGDSGYAFTAALPLGMARYALEAFRELAGGRGIRMLGYQKMNDSAIVQTAIATARANITMIESYQRWVLSTLQPGAERITDPMLAGAGGTQCYKLAREAIERLFDVCPTDEIRLDRPIQRLLRDLLAFTHQGAMAPYVNWERYGRYLVGAAGGSSSPPLPPAR
ncbi:MAG TPA: acyl-CoA dehydrogenase family protein [Trebonia sp.]|jgi:alkylation response protein AidB-like acyl-CoA dehydrogenase|nr:acyl-CoA dehydrogenase family protein [Trebonia sp.]